MGNIRLPKFMTSQLERLSGKFDYNFRIEVVHFKNKIFSAALLNKKRSFDKKIFLLNKNHSFEEIKYFLLNC